MYFLLGALSLQTESGKYSPLPTSTSARAARGWERGVLFQRAVESVELALLEVGRELAHAYGASSGRSWKSAQSNMARHVCQKSFRRLIDVDSSAR